VPSRIRLIGKFILKRDRGANGASRKHHIPRANSRADRFGMVVASLCFAHCIAGPVLLTLVGFRSLLHVSERFEYVFLLASAAMGLAALLPAFLKTHGRISCLAMFCGGLLCLSLKRYSDSRGIAPEMVVVGVGAGLLVGAHALNLRFCRLCPCCDPSAEHNASKTLRPARPAR
jgi:MerC mercury resistance protein